MFSKNPTKESLREMLQAKCDNAMLLDNSVHKLYAAKELPSKQPYNPRRKKPHADAYELEIQRLTQARDEGVEPDSVAVQVHQAASTQLDIQALEAEAAAFLRSRRRK
ncbi:hypothetical protein F2S72_09615 [Pseudomonas syringae pv. actinidiae]|nr:hypothetical protein [Pseudomonas syringae pv. actinidiae]